MTTRWSFAFFMSYDEITNQYGYGAVEISWRISAPVGCVFPLFSYPE